MGDHSKDNLVRALPAAAEHQAALKRVFGTKQAKARYPDKRAVALLDRWRCYCFSEVSSTMNIAAQLTRNHVPEEIRLGFIAGTGGASAEEALVVARCQKAGRGRDGRCWHSPAASGVYASFLLFPPESSRCEAGYSLALGVGICRVLGRFGLCC
ncbi:MAG TPA: hypothetical protein PLP17_10015, partial [Oligoflexia bacterium]|nr:hypothetical protein [Oligoflexia bacterium]